MATEEPKTKPSDTESREETASTTAPTSTVNEPPSQADSSMGEHCVTDRETPSGATPAGELSKIAEVDVYISKPKDYPASPSKLLLLLSSGTGITSTNNQLQADRYATEGFLVVMPDQFAGDPAPNTKPSGPENTTVIEQVKLKAAETVQSFMIDMWLARHTPEKVMPILQKVITGAKEEFADAVANGEGIYAVGYCFGAKYVLLLGSTLPDTEAHGQKSEGNEEGVVKNGPQIKAGAIAHGTMITENDFAEITAPISFVCVENDPLFPDEIRDSGKKQLDAKKIEYESKTYTGVPHGFAVVGEYEEAKIKESQESAFDQMVGWIKSH